jgi:hypothetical protein
LESADGGIPPELGSGSEVDDEHAIGRELVATGNLVEVGVDGDSRAVFIEHIRSDTQIVRLSVVESGQTLLLGTGGEGNDAQECEEELFHSKMCMMMRAPTGTTRNVQRKMMSIM